MCKEIRDAHSSGHSCSFSPCLLVVDVVAVKRKSNLGSSGGDVDRHMDRVCLYYPSPLQIIYTGFSPLEFSMAGMLTGVFTIVS